MQTQISLEVSCNTERTRKDTNKQAVADYLRIKLGKRTKKIQTRNDMPEFKMLEDEKVKAIAVGTNQTLKKTLDEVRSDIKYID